MAEFRHLLAYRFWLDSKIPVKLQFHIWGHEIPILPHAILDAPKIVIFCLFTYTCVDSILWNSGPKVALIVDFLHTALRDPNRRQISHFNHCQLL